ncbi:MAG: hypothetical protein A3D94_20720 [Alphaproteobacteria bacterium RIFCSPHIGHO2_12_FULL_66_14]|jgi:uncharacterized protein YjiS (DUF1127 family)|nr:MAG: hypothetical protein A3D94_20720 [Alphaproteobacteria bacterium RIFCSPHIGHO2_12_FULL_66_14]
MADVSLYYRSEVPVMATVSAVGQLFATWRRRTKERHQLADLDPRTIRDIGLSPSEIQFEANKPFWRG